MRNSHHHESTGGIGWSAFLAGAFIGAGVALILAPQRGAELRGMLSDYANRAKDDLLDEAEETWDTAVERGRDYYDKGEKVVREAGRSAREFAAQGQETVNDVGRSAKEFAKRAQDAARETKG